MSSRINAMQKILVVDDHAAARKSVAEIMTALGFDVQALSSASEALAFLQDQTVDLVFTDLMMPGMDGLQFIQALNQRRIQSQVVMFTAHGSVDTAVRAMKLGAFDYVEKPFTLEQLEDVAARALRQRDVLQRDRSTEDDWEMIGQSPQMEKLKQRIRQVAATDETVLIAGESGTGKELVARAIHQWSPRQSMPWVAVNCPALSPQLMESEWFGHEKGSFTNAEQNRAGRFEMANEGTILLDEVSEIEIGLQAKLLRVLQERCYERVGSSKTRSLDVRVLATTNRDMQAEINKGSFRQDLYYRLNVIPIELPALRERRDDIVPLAEHFLQKASQRTGMPLLSLDSANCSLLEDYAWPGNIRELENLMTRVSVLGQQEDIALVLSDWLSDGNPSQKTAKVPDANVETLAFSARIKAGVSLQEMERQLVEATLEQFDGHREKTAHALGIGVRTLTNKLRSYGYAPREKSFQKAA